MVNEWSDPRRQWIRSSKCEVSTCLEMAREPDYVYVRDSTDPAVELALTHHQWQGFVAGVVAGGYDR